MDIDNLENSYLRRKELIEEMDRLGKEKISCASCTGRCCTSFANSMQCTPLEALEIVKWLQSKNGLTAHLEGLVRQCIEDYRLNYEIPTSRGVPFRRTYTCPFFNHGPLGCLLAPEIKPYGCLGFNPTSKDVTDGENCKSSFNLLEKRDELWSSSEADQIKQIKKELGLSWEKLPMPVALIDVMERLDIKWDQV